MRRTSPVSTVPRRGLCLSLALLACSCSEPAPPDADADLDTDADQDPCPGGCLIEGDCLEDGASSPEDACLRCDPARSAEAWTFAEGRPCDDGSYCTTGDRCAAGACAGEPLSCDDGVACNGEERCDEEARACRPGQATCAAGLLCDAAADECRPACAGCAIDGVCYAEGSPNPLNGCLRCLPGVAAGAWSAADGEPCADGLFCDGADSCLGGACAAHAGSPCAGGERCDEAGERCCALEAELACGAAGDVVWLDACGAEGALVTDCPDEHGRCEAGACRCEEGWQGEGCATCVVHVSAATGEDGRSGATWATALATVSAGLDAAQREGCEVWVAAGTYTPTDGLDRRATFTLRAGVRLLGGFAGDEASAELRDPAAHPTVLSGDLGLTGDRSDNAYHVVTGVDGATLDGFVVTGGQADGDGPDGVGGGLFNPSASPLVERCTFEDNRAASGGGLYSSQGSPRVRECVFRDNRAAFGAGLHNDDAGTVVEDTLFEGNLASERGGAARNLDGAPSFTRCRFEGNEAAYGGALASSESAPVVAESTFSGNRATLDGGALYNNGFARTAVGASRFEGNSAGRDGGAIASYESDVYVAASTFAGNSADGDGGAIANLRADPTLVSCLFEENLAGGDGGGLADDDSDPLVLACTFRGNEALGAGGGISGASSTPTVLGSILWGNLSPAATATARQLTGGTSRVTWTDVEGGLAGEGNRGDDPLFEPGSSALQPGSPLCDLVDPFALPDDLADLDADLDRLERTPLDAAGGHRLVGPALDLGALEVQVEGTPPSLLEVRAAGETEVVLLFDEPLDEALVVEPAHYALDGGALVLAARPGRLGRWVHLTTTALTECQEYRLTLDGLADLAGNALAPGTSASFTMPRRLLADDFDDGDRAGWLAVDQGEPGEESDWVVAGGRVYQLSNIFRSGDIARGTYLFWAAPAAGSWADYELTAWLGSPDDDGLGLMFHVQDQNNFDLIWLNEQHDQRRLISVRGGWSWTAASRDGGYRLDRLQELRLLISGAQVQVFLDDVDLFEGPVTLSDPLPGGSVALFCWANDGAYFDDVSVLGACD